MPIAISPPLTPCPQRSLVCPQSQRTISAGVRRQFGLGFPHQPDRHHADRGGDSWLLPAGQCLLQQRQQYCVCAQLRLGMRRSCSGPGSVAQLNIPSQTITGHRAGRRRQCWPDERHHSVCGRDILYRRPNLRFGEHQQHDAQHRQLGCDHRRASHHDGAFDQQQALHWRRDLQQYHRRMPVGGQCHQQHRRPAAAAEGRCDRHASRLPIATWCM